MAKLLLVFALFLKIIYGQDVDYSDNHAQVLILGAGSAGIQAAATLNENGMDDFIIIEGADYIGGRVKNANFNGQTINVGSQWASPGGGSEIVQKMIRDWGIEGHEIDVVSTVYRNCSGQLVPEEETNPIWGRLDAALAKATEIANYILDNDLPDISQRTALLEGGWYPKTALEKAIEWLSFDFATSERTSVTALLSTIFVNYVEDIHYITDERGYAEIFRFIAPFLYDDAMFADHVRLNQVVTTIDYSNPDMVVVTTSDGTEYTGDRVLVTFSLGVFQNEVVQYIPELPDWKKHVLFKTSVTYYNPIFINFAEPFWDDAELIMNVHEQYNYYPDFFNFDVFQSQQSRWPDNHVLTIHILGDDALRVDQQSDEETKAEVEAVLQKMYGLEEPPNATDFLIQSWSKDPLHLAGYCNWPVELDRKEFPKLQHRVGNVFFAGEATDADSLGFVQGAMNSGEREALKILECIAGNECPEYVAEGERMRSNKRRKNCNVGDCSRP
ncbi:uncharacterized protein [Amphiura filiformis]|uniref:uncharacterized protein n=1 Tax=Amphiura filiformis TaxID=82378 RepID=UPI003B217144